MRTHRWTRHGLLLVPTRRPSRLKPVVPALASNRKPPAMARFFKKLINWFWSTRAEWKIAAVSRHQPASSTPRGRVQRPSRSSTPEPISKAAAGQISTAGTR